jgi:hypothetical protein
MGGSPHCYRHLGLCATLAIYDTCCRFLFSVLQGMVDMAGNRCVTIRARCFPPCSLASRNFDAVHAFFGISTLSLQYCFDWLDLMLLLSYT